MKWPVPCRECICRLTIYHLGVAHEAPKPNSEDPEAAGEAGLLKQGPGAFHNASDRALAMGIALMAVRRGLVMRKLEVLASPDEFCGAVRIYALRNNIAVNLLRRVVSV